MRASVALLVESSLLFGVVPDELWAVRATALWRGRLP